MTRRSSRAGRFLAGVAQPCRQHAAGEADVADLAVLIGMLGFWDMRTVTLRAAVSALAWARVSDGWLEAVMFPAHQQDVLCHLRASEVVGVHTKEPVDDLDWVVTINQVEGVVDDLPQSRY